MTRNSDLVQKPSYRRTKSCVDAVIMLFTRCFDYVSVIFLLYVQYFYSLWP